MTPPPVGATLEGAPTLAAIETAKALNDARVALKAGLQDAITAAWQSLLSDGLKRGVPRDELVVMWQQMTALGPKG